MNQKWLLALALGLSAGIPACGSPETSDSSGAGGAIVGAGGSMTGGSAAGGSATGGQASGGAASGGAAAGGSPAAGGTASGGAAAGGSASGGSASGGETAAGGTSASGGSGTGGAETSDVRPSAGCQVADGADKFTAGGSSVANALATSVRLTINAGGSNRDYIVDIPADYDPTHPYRLIFSWHQAYGSANGNATGLYPANNGPNFDAQHYAYFGLHRAAADAGESAIFIAPQGIGDFPWDYARDVVVFDALLARAAENLCIDEGRVFTTGFSFGAMMSHALSLGRASKLRGAVTMAPANYNFTQPTQDSPNIAYFSITGMSDGTCKWVNNDGNQTGGKYCSIGHAEDNGCTIPANLPTATNGSKNHVCYDYEGCKEGYPVKVCTFDGGHTPSSVSDGMSGGDDGLKAFVPPLAWEFISSL